MCIFVVPLLCVSILTAPHEQRPCHPHSSDTILSINTTKWGLTITDIYKYIHKYAYTMTGRYSKLITWSTLCTRFVYHVSVPTWNTLSYTMLILLTHSAPTGAILLWSEGWDLPSQSRVYSDQRHFHSRLQLRPPQPLTHFPLSNFSNGWDRRLGAAQPALHCSLAPAPPPALHLT